MNFKRAIFQTFWKHHCFTKFLFFELEASNFGYLLILKFCKSVQRACRTKFYMTFYRNRKFELFASEFIIYKSCGKLSLEQDKIECVSVNVKFIIRFLRKRNSFFSHSFYATFQCKCYNSFKRIKILFFPIKIMQSKVANNRLGWAVFSTANHPQTSPNLKFTLFASINPPKIQKFKSLVVNLIFCRVPFYEYAFYQKSYRTDLEQFHPACFARCQLRWQSAVHQSKPAEQHVARAQRTAHQLPF